MTAPTRRLPAGHRTLLDARLAESARLAAQAQTSQAEDEERAA